MFLHVNALESGYALTNLHFLDIDNKILEKRMHNSQFTST